MYACPDCAASVDLGRYPAGRNTCPNCGAAMGAEGDRPWIGVARIRNLAEAGFLTDELVGLGIDARIHQLDEFSALTDRWASLYLIRVPAANAQDAAARIRKYLAEESHEPESDASSFRFSTHDQPMDPLLWRPVALVVLAGVASFVLGQRFSDHKEVPADRRPPRNSLATAMEAIGRPLVTQPEVGESRHRLSFDRRHETWFLESDRDGDGQYDTRQAFHASGAAW